MIKNQWYAILPSRNVKPNGLLAVKRLNLNLVLFRNSKGDLGCVVDRCSHRGAQLSKGTLKRDCLQCPFHGIEFDRYGSCTFIPAYGASYSSDLSQFNVTHYLVRESHEIIYLWYGDPTDATNQLPFFDDFVDETYSYSEMEDLWNSHYSRCIENQLDVVHVPIVHYNTIGKGNKTLINGPKVEVEHNMIRTSANNDADLEQQPKKPEECVIKNTYLSFLFPNLWMNHISDKVKVIIYFAPVDDENTILYIRFYGNLTKSKLVNQIIASAGKVANRIIERQDKRVVITQEPKASSLYSEENLLVGDGPIIMYRKIREELNQKADIT
jgi:phenylpropionate dioxygenase-like ring-hydroxylating dioxygenase large terminal subunit